MQKQHPRTQEQAARTGVRDDSGRRRRDGEGDATGPQDSAGTEVHEAASLHPAVDSERTGVRFSLVQALLWEGEDVASEVHEVPESADLLVRVVSAAAAAATAGTDTAAAAATG